MRNINCTMAVVLAVALIGCGKKEAPISDEQIVGNWVLSVELSPDDAISTQVREAIEEAGLMALELRSDHSFTLTVAKSRSSGKWKVTDSGVSLTYSDIAGPALGDGKTLRLGLNESGLETDPTESGATWLFTRSPG